MNTAAIYVTNRNILKKYMQGMISFQAQAKAPIPAPAQHTPTKTVQAPASKPQVPKKPEAPPVAKTPVAPKAPSKPKTPHDHLLSELYSNLEGWKKNRDAYLEAEKSFVDYEEAKHPPQPLEDVERIKSQIAEEVIAEEAKKASELSTPEDTAQTVEAETAHEADTAEAKTSTEAGGENIADEEKTNVEDTVTSEIDEATSVEEPVSEVEEHVAQAEEAPTAEEEVEETTDTEPVEMVEEAVEEQEAEEESEVADEIEEEEEVEEVQDEVETDESEEEIAEEEEEIAEEEEEISPEAIDQEVEESPEPDNASIAAEMDEELHHLEEEKANLKLTPGSSKKFRLAFLRKPTKKSSEESGKTAKPKSSTKTTKTSTAKKKTTAAKKTTATKKTTTAKKSVAKEVKKPKETEEKKPASKKKSTTSTTKSTTKKKPPTRKLSISSLAAKATKKIAEKKSDSKKSTKGAESEDTESKKKKTEVKTAAKKTTKTAKSNPAKSQEQDKLIEQFLEKNPTIEAPKVGEDDADNRDLTEKSNAFPEEVVTENMAKILLDQGKIDKAILIYERLKKQQPKKKTYFQTKIDRLKDQDDQKQPATTKTKKSEDTKTKALHKEFLVDNPGIIALTWDDLCEVILNLTSDRDKLFSELEITENLAQILEKLSKPADAIAVYEKLIEREPDQRAHFIKQIARLRAK